MSELRLSRDDLHTLRAALRALYKREANRMRRIQAGKIKRTRPSEQAMYMADVKALFDRINEEIEGLL